MLVRPCLVLICAALHFCSVAGAQPSVFKSATLDDAIAEARGSRRLLIVYPCVDKYQWKQMLETTWMSPTLREWMLWHGNALRIDSTDEREEFERVRRECILFSGRDPAKEPMVLVYRDGVLDRTIPDAIFGVSSITGYPTTLQVLYGLDFYMDKLRAVDPGWWAAHDLANPMPPPPPPEPPMWETPDENGPSFAPGDGDALRVLEDAREQVKFGSLYDATAAYSWLWEEAARDPALAPVRTLMAREDIPDLVHRREGARKRFGDLRDRLREREPWWSYIDLYDWMVLSQALDDNASVIRYFELFLNDPQEASIVGLADKAAYALLTGTGGPGNFVAPARAIEWIREQAPRLSAAAPPRMAAEQWAKVQALRRRLMLDTACVAYAHALSAGKDELAESISQQVISILDSGQTRIALVASALAVGKANAARDEAMLAEAAARGADRPQLLARVRAVPAQ